MAIFKADGFAIGQGNPGLASNSSKAAPCLAVDVVTLSGAVADNDIIVLMKLPVEARSDEINIFSDDLGTTGDFNVGLYPGNIKADNLTVADATDEDCFATALDVNAAPLGGVNVRFEAADLNGIGKALWEVAGLAEKPAYGDFYLCLTATEATTAAGEVAFSTRYFTV